MEEEEKSFISCDVILIDDGRGDFDPNRYYEDLEKNYLYNIFYRIVLFEQNDLIGDVSVFLPEGTKMLDVETVQLIANVWLDRLKSDYKLTSTIQLENDSINDSDRAVLNMFRAPGTKQMMEWIFHLDNIFQQLIEEELIQIEHHGDEVLEQRLKIMEEQFKDTEDEEIKIALTSGASAMQIKFMEKQDKIKEYLRSFRYDFFNALLFKYAFGFNVIPDMLVMMKEWVNVGRDQIKKKNIFDYPYDNPVLFRGYFQKPVTLIRKNFMELWDTLKYMNENPQICDELVNDAVTMIFKSFLISKTMKYKEQGDELTKQLKNLYAYAVLSSDKEIRDEARKRNKEELIQFMDQYSERTEKKPRLKTDDIDNMSDVVKIGVDVRHKKQKQEYVDQIFN